MKIAILSDIHAYPAAAQKAYDDAKSLGCEQFVCLGDVVGYGPDPVGAIDWVRRHINLCLIRGNHDDALIGNLPIRWFSDFAASAIRKHMKMVSEDDKKWLKESSGYSYNSTYDWLSVSYAHGSAYKPQVFNYIANTQSACNEMHWMKVNNINVEFVGHTHFATLDRMEEDKDLDGDEYCQLVNESLNIPEKKIKPGIRYVFNVGSVGYPRNQKDSIYCVFNTEAKTVVYRKLPFDLQQYYGDMLNAEMDIPGWLDDRMSMEAIANPL